MGQIHLQAGSENRDHTVAQSSALAAEDAGTRLECAHSADLTQRERERQRLQRQWRGLRTAVTRVRYASVVSAVALIACYFLSPLLGGPREPFEPRPWWVRQLPLLAALCQVIGPITYVMSRRWMAVLRGRANDLGFDLEASAPSDAQGARDPSRAGDRPSGTPSV